MVDVDTVFDWISTGKFNFGIVSFTNLRTLGVYPKSCIILLILFIYLLYYMLYILN